MKTFTCKKQRLFNRAMMSEVVIVIIIVTATEQPVFKKRAALDVFWFIFGGVLWQCKFHAHFERVIGLRPHCRVALNIVHSGSIPVCTRITLS